MTQKQTKVPTWLFVSRTFGLLIVAVVMVGWERGRNISEPGVLALLGIAVALLSLNVSETVRRAVNGHSSGYLSNSPGSPPLSQLSDTDSPTTPSVLD